MNLPFRQQGISALSMLVILLVAIFFGTCAIKVAPVYMENMTIQGALETVVTDAEVGDIKTTEIKGKLSKLFQVNMTEAIGIKDVKITRDKGKVIVDARYERRVPLMFNIDVVVKFDQLLYEFSEYSKR
jgi:Domain of unknown function (DUF4845)